VSEQGEKKMIVIPTAEELARRIAAVRVALKPHLVRCPYCQAAPGDPCRSSKGQPYGPGHGDGQYHAERRGKPTTWTKATKSQRRLAGRVGGLRSWANTVDRAERTAPARKAGPSSVEYWLHRLDERFDHATTEERLAAAQSAKLAHYHELARRSAVTRAAKAAARHRLPLPPK
jgi:hypothetical protein